MPVLSAASEARHEPITHGAALPEKPLVVIRPTRGWVALNLRDLWACRELLYFLVWRDVKVRYRQTLLGAAWAVIQPLCTMLLFALFFGQLAGMPSDDVPYAAFAYAGLLAWTFFAGAVTSSGNSLVGSANLISKVYFPRLIIPAAAVLACLVDFAIASTVMVVLLVYYGIALTWTALLLPVLVGLLVLLATAVGMWTAALNVQYRDVRHALPFVIQLWMFATPVIYPASIVPQQWRWLLGLNPLTGIVEGFRAAWFGRDVDWSMLGLATLIVVGMTCYSAYAFRRLERSFADVI
jgi:lipopolysaccharide transport system permease protein